MLPPFEPETGRLPEGEHAVSWDELVDTAKDEPADFDACWDPAGVDLDILDPVFFDLSSGRANQKARFGGELFPNVAESGSGLVFADFFKNEETVAKRASSSCRSESHHDHQRSPAPLDRGAPAPVRGGARQPQG